MGDGCRPYPISHSAAVRDNSWIGRGSTTGKPTAGFKNRKHHKIVIEQPIVIGWQCVSIDEVPRKPTNIFPGRDIVRCYGEAPAGVVNVRDGDHPRALDALTCCGDIPNEIQPRPMPSQIISLLG